MNTYPEVHSERIFLFHPDRFNQNLSIYFKQQWLTKLFYLLILKICFELKFNVNIDDTTFIEVKD